MYLIGNREFEQELKDVDRLMGDMRAIGELANVALESSRKAFEIPERDERGFEQKYSNPLYDFQHAINDAREKGPQQLADYLVKRWTRLLVPNIKTSLNEILSDCTIKTKDGRGNRADNEEYEREMSCYDLEKGFEAKWLMQLFKKKYINNAVELSLEAILTEAKHLIPNITWERKTTVKDILDKRTLKLHLRIGYGNTANGSESQLSALVKLSLIVLKNENPVIVTDNTVPFDPFNWRSFKNGSLTAKFHTEEDAQKVAEVLINGFPKT